MSVDLVLERWRTLRSCLLTTTMVVAAAALLGALLPGAALASVGPPVGPSVGGLAPTGLLQQDPMAGDREENQGSDGDTAPSAAGKRDKKKPAQGAGTAPKAVAKAKPGEKKPEPAAAGKAAGTGAAGLKAVAARKAGAAKPKPVAPKAPPAGVAKPPKAPKPPPVPPKAKPGTPPPATAKAKASPAGTRLSGPLHWLGWNQRLIWLGLALAGLALVLYLLHLLLPFKPLWFLVKLGHMILWLAMLSLVGSAVVDLLGAGRLPGSYQQSAMVWFAICLVAFYLVFRRRLPEVHLAGLFLGMVLVLVLGAALAKVVPVPGFRTGIQRVRPEFAPIILLNYTALACLAAAAVFQVTSSWLGFLARRSRGDGYGMPPERWDSYRMLPAQVLYVALPLLTLAVLGTIALSIGAVARPFAGWQMEPRLIAVLFGWFVAFAALLAYRDDGWQKRVAPLFLTLGVAATGALFVYVHQLAALLRG